MKLQDKNETYYFNIHVVSVYMYTVYRALSERATEWYSMQYFNNAIFFVLNCQ